MIKKLKNKREINLLIVVFLTIGIFGIVIKYFEFYNIKIINDTTNNIYEHPLKVSNAALTIKLGVYKIHRDMKDIVLSLSKEELLTLIKQVDNHEMLIYKNFNIIENKILGDDGLKLEKVTRKLFDEWKPIRDKVILLVKNNQQKHAIILTKGIGAQHVVHLEAAISKLYNYAQNKAISFKNKSESSFQTLKIINLFISMLFFVLFALISYYIIQRISRYISKNDDYIIELAQKQKEFETIFNQAPMPMIIHNEDGEISMVNKVWEDLSGYKYTEINTIAKWINKTCPNNSKLTNEHIKELYSITKRVDEGEFELLTKSGEKIIWTFSSAPLGIKDGKRILISTATDITEIKRKDKMILIQSRHAALGEMIGMIAHQWRQPLSIIAMNTNNILLDIELDTLDTNQLKIHSNEILTQTEHLSATINNFRNFFKPDKEMSQVELSYIIHETYAIVKESLESQNITVNISCSSNSLVNVYHRELMQVFVNIITNAKDSFLLNKKEKANIKIKIFEDKSYVITQICDNGSGINMNILPKIFDPYFSTKTEQNGTGLGLHMSKMIIEDHLNGKIEAYNDNGACFTIKLPKL